MAYVKTFIPNEADDLHCLQACHRMLIESLVGSRPTLEDSERATGFREGWPTWQFALLRDLADRGYPVVDIEQFSVDHFLAAPEAAIAAQVGDAVVARQILNTMDVPLEVERLRNCRYHDLIRFVNKAPSMADLRSALSHHAYALCNVNGNVLHDKVGYVGHLVIVQEVGDDWCSLQDPGLPPGPDMKVSLAKFLEAWHYPKATMANVYAVFPSRAAWIGFVKSVNVSSIPAVDQ
ncbi:MAG TPA: hypothetical protein VGR26_02330 [Acidimicrobiales bacterium]|nr:hypothetical protein [Acidimicrobiales bacterium]